MTTEICVAFVLLVLFGGLGPLIALRRPRPEPPTLKDHFENAQSIAPQFHAAYEAFAPIFGYETRPESAVPWDEVPAHQRDLMVQTIGHLLIHGVIIAPEADDEE